MRQNGRTVIESILSFFFFSSLEAFFAISEISFVSAERSLVEGLGGRSQRAKICKKLWDDPERLFTTTTLGVTFSIAGNGFFTSYYLIKSFGYYGVILSSFFLPIFILILGQIIPKTLGKKFAYPLVIYLSVPLYIVSFIFYPIYLINKKLSKTFLKDRSETPYFLTKFRETFLTMITYEEEIDYKEKELINRIIEFGKKRVSQVMIPLSNIKALPIDAKIRDAIEFTSKYNFSYIPLYDGDLTKIKYIVKVQDLLGEDIFNEEDPLRKFAKVPLYIPEIIPAHEALKTLQREIQEIAIIVNEYGIVSGLVTIEDLIEEVLGEFRDALDYYEPEIKRLSPGVFIVKGTIEIEKIQGLGLNVPSGDYETLNGFIYKLLNRIPKAGETFSYADIDFQILKADPLMVEEVLIRVKKSKK